MSDLSTFIANQSSEKTGETNTELLKAFSQKPTVVTPKPPVTPTEVLPKPTAQDNKLERQKRKRKEAPKSWHYMISVAKKPRIDDEAERQIFVGNLPLETKEKKLRSIFTPYGKIETIRFRSEPFSNPHNVKIRSHVEKDFIPNRTSKNAYIQFETVEAAKAALAQDNAKFGPPDNRKHIRVDLAVNNNRVRHVKTTVFVGNLPIYTEEEPLRKVFKSCGKILSVRVIRDSQFHSCLGFGFISFKDKQGQANAIKLNQKLFYEGQKLRISVFKKTTILAKEKDRKTESATPTNTNQAETQQSVPKAINNGPNVGQSTKKDNSVSKGLVKRRNQRATKNKGNPASKPPMQRKGQKFPMKNKGPKMNNVAKSPMENKGQKFPMKNKGPKLTRNDRPNPRNNDAKVPMKKVDDQNKVQAESTATQKRFTFRNLQ
eukprot:TRINITY_DN6172_c0_g2_i1.p1 TRINITY_DN6172_c0_g2~~TRINITY_DN6172_c0_g2_i1.p1  ORF type:complete len:431 (-),score=80.14 TRINITY_DN6172_c0_g2_i1:19-1311(-)